MISLEDLYMRERNKLFYSYRKKLRHKKEITDTVVLVGLYKIWTGELNKQTAANILGMAVSVFSDALAVRAFYDKDTGEIIRTTRQSLTNFITGEFVGNDQVKKYQQSKEPKFTWPDSLSWFAKNSLQDEYDELVFNEITKNIYVIDEKEKAMDTKLKSYLNEDGLIPVGAYKTNYITPNKIREIFHTVQLSNKPYTKLAEILGIDKGSLSDIIRGCNKQVRYVLGVSFNQYNRIKLKDSPIHIFPYIDGIDYVQDVIKTSNEIRKELTIIPKTGNGNSDTLYIISNAQLNELSEAVVIEKKDLIFNTIKTQIEKKDESIVELRQSITVLKRKLEELDTKTTSDSEYIDTHKRKLDRITENNNRNTILLNAAVSEYSEHIQKDTDII